MWQVTRQLFGCEKGYDESSHPSALPQAASPVALVLASAKVLEVAGGAVDEYIDDRVVAIEAAAAQKGPVRHLFLHLGVDSGASAIALEQCALNCKHWPSGDMRRNVARNASIEPPAVLQQQAVTVRQGDTTLTYYPHQRITRFAVCGPQLLQAANATRTSNPSPVTQLLGWRSAPRAEVTSEQLAEASADENTPICIASQDAGTYLCNYMYYNSLWRLASGRGGAVVSLLRGSADPPQYASEAAVVPADEVPGFLDAADPPRPDGAMVDSVFVHVVNLDTMPLESQAEVILALIRGMLAM